MRVGGGSGGGSGSGGSSDENKRGRLARDSGERLFLEIQNNAAISCQSVGAVSTRIGSYLMFVLTLSKACAAV